jgi:hypothetical protein
VWNRAQHREYASCPHTNSQHGSLEVLVPLLLLALLLVLLLLLPWLLHWQCGELLTLIISRCVTLNSEDCGSSMVAMTACSEWLCITAPAPRSSYACRGVTGRHRRWGPGQWEQTNDPAGAAAAAAKRTGPVAAAAALLGVQERPMVKRAMLRARHCCCCCCCCRRVCVGLAAGWLLNQLSTADTSQAPWGEAAAGPCSLQSTV